MFTIANRALVILALVAGAFATEAEAAPAKKLKADRGHPSYVFADTSFTPGEVNRVLIVSFNNTTTTANAFDKFYPHIEAALRDRPQYVFVPPTQLEREAIAKGVKEDFIALARQWDSDREFVPQVLTRFATALNATLIMGGEISEWTSEQVAWNVEGYSHSDVEAHLKLYSGVNGKLVWEGRDRVELKSAPHDPRAAAGIVDDLNIQRGRQPVPPAPPIDEAAKRVARNLAASLP